MHWHILKVVALIPITAAVAGAVMLGVYGWEGALIAALVGAICAAVCGVPVLFVATERGRTRLQDLAVLGALAGAAPTILLWAVTWTARSLFADRSLPSSTAGVSSVGTVLLFGVPALIGALSGVIYWLTMLDRHLPRVAAWGLSAALLWLATWIFGWR